jgi:hypothetical protein
VTAPWGVVLNKDVFGRVVYDVTPLGSDELLDWAIIGFWDWLTLLESSKLTSFEVINESFHRFGVDVSNGSWEGELHKVFSELDESESWGVFCSDTTVLSKLSLDSFRSG